MHHHPRDKLTERKRYLSKSREAIFEKGANSNLKKSVSKSRERLCVMKSLSLSKSRDYLNESTKQLSRAQEKFSNFKTISKSQEGLSPALGGNMKRMVAGAVSDIPAHNLPINPRVYLDTQADCSDFVMVPGSSVLMSHSELMAISGSKSSGSLQLLPISESKAGSPAPSEPCNDRPGSRGGVPMVATVREEEEEEEVEVAGGRRDEASQASLTTPANLARSRSITETKTFRLKEEKNHINYETQQSMSRGEAKARLATAEVAIQVDLSKTPVPSSPLPPGNQSTSSRGATPTLLSEPSPTSPPPPPALPPALLPGSSSTLPAGSSNLLKAAATLVSSAIPTEGNIRPSPGTRLARGFSHDDTLGGDEKRYSWREELEKFRASRRPLGGVSSLIDAFSSGATLAGSSSASSSRKSSTVDSFPDLEGVKARRRGSLQIQLDSASIAQLATRGETVPERENASKLQRRKSTSAIPPLRLSEALPNIDEAAAQPKDLKAGDLKEDDRSSENKNATTGDKLDPDKAVSETDASKEDGKTKKEKEESRGDNN